MMSDKSDHSNKLDIQLACMELMWWPIGSAGAMTDWLDEVVTAGYEGVGLFDQSLLQYYEERQLVEQLASRNLSLASVDYTIDRDESRLRRVCAIMQQLGAPHLVAIGGLAKRNANIDDVADTLNWIGGIALEYDVRACYHNHTDHTGETLEETEAIVGKTDPTRFFGFLDVGHATKDFIGHPVDRRAAIFLERNWDRLDFLEFKDWCKTHELHTPVGAGACDYRRVFQILKDRGYRGWITIEQNGPMGDRTSLQCATESRQFIRQGLGV